MTIFEWQVLGMKKFGLRSTALALVHFKHVLTNPPRGFVVELQHGGVMPCARLIGAVALRTWLYHGSEDN